MSPRPLLVQGRPLAGGRLPAVCAPLVARDAAALAQEAAAVAAKRPDLLEWRVDFFRALGDIEQVLAAARALRAAAGGIPILFTRRAQREGGEPIALDENGVMEVYRAVCESGLVDLVDTEMVHGPQQVGTLREVTRRCGLPLVLSFHDFQATPPRAALLERFRLAQALGADAAKLAVMPRSMQDVHELLGATLQASGELGIPVIGMAMGPMGAVSRLCGGAFGSALTFAVAAQASAPGQMPIDDVRAGLALLQRAGQAGA